MNTSGLLQSKSSYLHFILSFKHQFSPNLADFPDMTEVSEWPKRQISALNVMAILYQGHIAVSKQTMLLAGVDMLGQSVT